MAVCTNCEHDNAQHNDDIGCGGIYCDCPMNGSVDLGMTPSKVRFRCGATDGGSSACVRWANHGGVHVDAAGDGFTPLAVDRGPCDSHTMKLDGQIIDCTMWGPHGGSHRNGDFRWEERNPDKRLVGSTQVGGNHYQETPIQPWAVIDAWGLDFYAGSALKYLYRAGRKGPKLEDLKKLRHYVDKLIELEEGKG